MSLVSHICTGPATQRPSDVEVELSRAVVAILGNAAQLSRIKLRLTAQLDAMKTIAASLEDDHQKSALIRQSEQSRAELERCFKTLSEATQQLPAMHHHLLANLSKRGLQV